MDSQRVVQVDGLTVRFKTPERVVEAVRDVSFHVNRGETLAIVGESGSGKSVTSLALMGLHRDTRAQLSGEIRVAGIDVVTASDQEIRAMRGNDIAMVFQDPMSSLHPQYTIGNQIIEAYLTAAQTAGAAVLAVNCWKIAGSMTVSPLRMTKSRSISCRASQQLARLSASLKKGLKTVRIFNFGLSSFFSKATTSAA